MAASDLRNLLERAQTWPEEAQNELVAIASEIESELLGGEYLATQEELRSIDMALASIDRGSIPFPAPKPIRRHRRIPHG